MDYTYKLTTHGRAAVAAGLELGRPLPITRVAFGSGKIAEDAELADQHALLRFVSDGAISGRRHEDDRLYISLQYANSQHPGVPTFQLWEFMLFVTDPDTGEETDFLYGTLGDYPQTAPAWRDDFPPCVFTFPLTLIISNELECAISAPVGLTTWDDMDAVIEALAVRRLDITIPASGWTSSAGTGYAVQCDVPVPSATDKMIPFLTVVPPGLSAADACGLAPFTETREGVLRVFARRAPTTPIPASLALAGDASGFLAVDASGQPYVLPPATRETLGGVKIGGGVDVMPDGTVSVDGAQIVENAAASDENAKEMLDAVFGAE